MKIGIVGIGLIGGSLAKAYIANGASVFGYDIDKDIIDFAKLSGALTGILDNNTIKDCDCIFLAVNPKDAVSYVEKTAREIEEKSIVIDCCGVKRYVCNKLFPLAREHGFTFVGGHPMAGSHTSGFKYSRANLFKGAPMVLVPPVYDDINLIGRLEEILKPVGFGRYSITTAEKHDLVIAFTSQMAHIVSNAYVKSNTAGAHKGFSAGSYKDLTRVARLNADMWSELCVENSDFLVSELNTLISALTQYKNTLTAGDTNTLRALLNEGSAIKTKLDG